MVAMVSRIRFKILQQKCNKIEKQNKGRDHKRGDLEAAGACDRHRAASNAVRLTLSRAKG